MQRPMNTLYTRLAYAPTKMYNLSLALFHIEEERSFGGYKRATGRVDNGGWPERKV